MDAKGKSEPIPAWAAVEARSPFGVDVRQHGGAPLVGRARELDLLAAAFERACAERSPELVTLVGVPWLLSTAQDSIWEVERPAPLAWLGAVNVVGVLVVYVLVIVVGRRERLAGPVTDRRVEPPRRSGAQAPDPTP